MINLDFLLYISNYIVPFVLFYIIGYGILCKVSVFQEFTKGAKDGLKTVLDILPTIIGLIIAVGVLRTSMALDIFASIVSPITKLFKFPSEIVPLVFVKTLSSSAANGLLIDIFKEYGPDSFLGRLSSIILSCTETIFYTMSIYFVTAEVKKTRYTLAGALLATTVGIIASVILTKLIFY